MKRFLILVSMFGLMVSSTSYASNFAQIIVRFKSTTADQSPQSIQGKLDQFQLNLKLVRPTIFNAYVVRIDTTLASSALRDETILYLRAQPEIDLAEENIVIHSPNEGYSTLSSNEDYRNRQWDMLDSNKNSIDADTTVWGFTKGSPDLMVGVLDTGACVNPSLAGTFVGGYDFNPNAVGPSDPMTKNGDWHGCIVSGVVAAHITAPGIEPIANLEGVAPNIKLVALNVFGARPETNVSDVANAIEWGLGHHVPGFPDNPYPVKIIQMSLGTGTAGGIYQSCPTIVQEAMDDAYRNNVVIAVSAGNENIPADQRIFARCNHIIPTAATSEVGTRSSFSNYGPHILIAAPGENILTTGNNSYTVAGGTSLAAPHVSGTVALMLSINPNLTSDQIIQILQKTAKPFATSPDEPIGMGIVNTLKAVTCVKDANNCLQ
jgi:serine protease